MFEIEERDGRAGGAVDGEVCGDLKPSGLQEGAGDREVVVGEKPEVEALADIDAGDLRWGYAVENVAAALCIGRRAPGDLAGADTVDTAGRVACVQIPLTLSIVINCAEALPATSRPASAAVFRVFLIMVSAPTAVLSERQRR